MESACHPASPSHERMNRKQYTGFGRHGRPSVIHNIIFVNAYIATSCTEWLGKLTMSEASSLFDRDAKCDEPVPWASGNCPPGAWLTKLCSQSNWSEWIYELIGLVLRGTLVK